MGMPIMEGNSRHQLTFENLRGLRAEGYIRDSTLDQRNGFGPDIQRHNIQRFAESYGLILGHRWYTEFVSGRSVSKRKEFQQFLEDARTGLFDVLLVDHTSRFGRNQVECITYKGELQRLGKVVVFASQGIVSGSDRDFLSERINETLDEAYSRNLSRYVRAGKAEKAAHGIALGNAPLGYRHAKNPDGKGVIPVLDPETIPLLTELLSTYASGEHSFHAVAQALNSKGYRTQTGKPFTTSSISTVLNNPFYTGKFIYHRGKPDEDVRDGIHEVSEEVKVLWERCQEVRREKATAPQPSPRSREHKIYALTGILVCDGCGEPWHGEVCYSKPGVYPRMAHSKRLCSMRPMSVSAPRIEKDLVERVLVHLTLDEDWRNAVLKALAKEGPQPDNSLDLKRLEMALTNLRKQHLWGAINDEEFKSQFQSLDGQRRALASAAKPVELPNLERGAELLKSLPALWRHPGVEDEQRQDVAREVFKEVRLRKGQIVAIMPRPQYASLFAYSVWRRPFAGGERSF